MDTPCQANAANKPQIRTRSRRIYSSSSSSASNVVIAIPIRNQSVLRRIFSYYSRAHTIQIPLAALSDATASLLLVLLKNANLLEGLHDLAVDGAGGVDVVRGPRAAVLRGAVNLAQTTDADGLA